MEVPPREHVHKEQLKVHGLGSDLCEKMAGERVLFIIQLAPEGVQPQLFVPVTLTPPHRRNLPTFLSC